MIFKVTRCLTYFMDSPSEEEARLRSNFYRFDLSQAVDFPGRPYEYHESSEIERFIPPERTFGVTK